MDYVWMREVERIFKEIVIAFNLFQFYVKKQYIHI